MPQPPYTAHVISHTHWDREWYRTFEVFRMRLVDLVDDLLDLLEADPSYGPFYLDGQVCPIEDYVEIRPENAGRLRNALASGRVYAGPWYVQPDEFLVSGESHIRNLLLGNRLALEWGTDAPVGYAPDAFGHTGQMPQILRGFGIGNAVLFRGITADQVGSEFRWVSPDGSGVLCIKMPDDNAYSNWYYRLRATLAGTDRGEPLDEDQAIQEVEALLEDSIAERPATRFLLWMDGVDHIFAQPRTPAIIRLANERLRHRVEIRASSLMEFVAEVDAAAPELPEVRGELRVSNRAWRLQALLAHVASSRIHLKQRNHECETLLERWAEPWSALAWVCARAFGPPQCRERLPRHAQEAPAQFLRHAWKQLLRNQPHDSICGCSIDQVHRDMLPRFDSAEQIGEKLTERALGAVAGWVDTRAVKRDHHDPDAVAALVVCNALGWDLNGAPVETVVSLPREISTEGIGIVGPDGPVDACSQEMDACHTMWQAPHDIPIGEAWRRFAVRFHADVPGFGYTTYHVIARRPALRAVAPADAVRVDGVSLDNGVLRVSAESAGTLSIEDYRTGLAYGGLLAFEDGGDFGDGYNYVPPATDLVMRTTMPSELAADTSATAALDGDDGVLTILHVWHVPASRDGDQRDATSQAPVVIRSEVRLRRGASIAELQITVENHARDHRLRVLFPSGAAGASLYTVEQAFHAASRPVVLPDCTGWREKQPGAGPQKAWVDVSDSERGLAVLNRGIPECEVLNDTERTVAITLLRCTGGGVGRPEDLVEGQMLGRWHFDLALAPHGPRTPLVEVWRKAHEFNVPVRAQQTGIHDGPLPASHRFLQTVGDALIPTAVKQTEDGKGLIVRAVHASEEPGVASLRHSLPGLRQGVRARLDEQRIDDGETVRPWEIVTWRADVS